MPASDWRPLIRETVARVWPLFDRGARWVEAQVEQESAGRPDAVSPVGAVGLLQLMPATAQELGVLSPMDPAQNLNGGVRYLKQQWERFPEIDATGRGDRVERLRWALAAYNGGRGYCNRALALAREDNTNRWWEWATGRYWLMHRSCVVGGRMPDYRQMWGYVEGVERRRRWLGLELGED